MSKPPKHIRVGAMALSQTPLDWDGNLQNILAALQEARAASVTVLCLPELCISGYGCEDAFLGSGTLEMSARVLQEILPHTRGLVVSIGLPVFHHNAVFNSAALVADGQLLGFYAKQHLAGDGIHYEPRWFKPWPAEAVSDIELGGELYPFGDLFFEAGGLRIGFEICEDAWVAARPGAALARRGIDIILNPSASHFAFGKQAVRERFVLEGSRAFGAVYVYSNLLGCEAGRAIYDGACLIAESGSMLARGKRFSFATRQLSSAVVDLSQTRLRRAQLSNSSIVLPEAEKNCVSVAFDFPVCSASSEPASCETSGWELSTTCQFEEFGRAVSLGLLDYLAKTGAGGYLVSLSGGADSSAVCVLIHYMLRFALDELKPEGLLKRLPQLKTASSTSDVREFMHELLGCAYQSTANSSGSTRLAARGLAAALGAAYWEFDVQKLVDQYLEMGEQALGRKMDWQQDDIALQNVQARVRGPGIWLLANLRKAILLTTSNRSEAAVGYATMDGDTCGGLAPLAGIDKAFLREWLKWAETTGAAECGPLPCLALVNALSPAAELRPLAAAQTDEKDLMPYEVLDAIEQLAIRDKRSPHETSEIMQGRLRGRYAADEIQTWVAKFYRLWAANQWKRERYAPCFHLDDENLDPKTWCRFPILSGAYRRELRELAKTA